MITGKELIDRGLKPGKWFKDALEHINTHNLEGAALEDYLDAMKPTPTIPLLAQPVSFHENIRADTPVEQANIDYVRQSMQLLMRTPTVVAGAIMPDACPARTSWDDSSRGHRGNAQRHPPRYAQRRYLLLRDADQFG